MPGGRSVRVRKLPKMIFFVQTNPAYGHDIFGIKFNQNDISDVFRGNHELNLHRFGIFHVCLQLSEYEIS